MAQDFQINGRRLGLAIASYALGFTLISLAFLSIFNLIVCRNEVELVFGPGEFSYTRTQFDAWHATCYQRLYYAHDGKNEHLSTTRMDVLNMQTFPSESEYARLHMEQFGMVLPDWAKENASGWKP